MATILILIEEYLHSSHAPDIEFVDGLLVARNSGTRLHGMLQLIAGSFSFPFRASHGLRTMTECRLLVSASGNRHRIPNVMVLEEPYTNGNVITDVPAIVIGIKSPDDTLDAVIDKCLEYATLGVPNIIVLQLPRSGKVLHLPVGRMFAELD